MAHLGSGIHFLGLRASGERSNPSHIFLRHRVLPWLWHTKEWRLLIHPAHFAGLAIMLGIFAAWAIPFLHSTTTQVAAVKWSNQFTGRLQGIDFKFASWIQNIPRGLIYFLPWVLLFPSSGFQSFIDHSEQRLARGLAWGIAVPFLALNLVPGALPRYSMPVIAPASWLLAMSYAGHALQWPWEKGTSDERTWAKIVALFVGVGARSWRDWLSSHGGSLEKQATSEEGRGGN